MCSAVAPLNHRLSNPSTPQAAELTKHMIDCSAVQRKSIYTILLIDDQICVWRVERWQSGLGWAKFPDGTDGWFLLRFFLKLSLSLASHLSRPHTDTAARLCSPFPCLPATPLSSHFLLSAIIPPSSLQPALLSMSLLSSASPAVFSFLSV